MNRTEEKIFKELEILSRKFSCEETPEVKEMSLSFNKNVSEEAKKIHEEAMIIDACSFNLKDYGWHLQEGKPTAINCTVPGERDGAEEAMSSIIKYYSTVNSEDKLMIVYNTDDILRAKKEDKVGVIIGAQNCEFINHHDLDASVELFAKAGLRVMQIAYSHRSFAADGCYTGTNAGITSDGVALIKAMEKHGVTVDLSHVGERSTLEAMEVSTKPVIFSHSNSKAKFDHQRNITDEQAKECASTGGVVGVSAYSPILWDGVNFPTIDTFIDAIEYYAGLIGIDHVGIGLDTNATAGAYDRDNNLYMSQLLQEVNGTEGMRYKAYVAGRGYKSLMTDGIESLANFVNVIDKLLKRGFKESDVKKVIGENWYRVFLQTWL